MQQLFFKRDIFSWTIALFAVLDENFPNFVFCQSTETVVLSLAMHGHVSIVPAHTCRLKDYEFSRITSDAPRTSFQRE